MMDLLRETGAGRSCPLGCVSWNNLQNLVVCEVKLHFSECFRAKQSSLGCLVVNIGILVYWLWHLWIEEF